MNPLIKLKLEAVDDDKLLLAAALAEASDDDSSDTDSSESDSDFDEPEEDIKPIIAVKVEGESERDGEFERLIQNIRQSSSTGMLAKDWNFFIQDNAEYRDDLRRASGIGRKHLKAGAHFSNRCLSLNGLQSNPGSGPVLSFQTKTLIGEGNQAYVDGDLPRAIRTMLEVIRIEPRAAPARSVLAQCYEDQKELPQALQLRIMGAHLKQDAEEWDRLARQSREMGYPQQALYCWAKGYHIDPSNVAALWDRGMLAKELGDLRTTRTAFLGILGRFPHELNILSELRTVLVDLDDFSTCTVLFQDAFDYFQTTFPSGRGRSATSGADEVPGAGFALLEILVLADLYNTIGEHERAIDVIRKGIRWLQGRAEQDDWDLCSDDREFDCEESYVERAVEEDDVDPGYYKLDVNARHRIAIARIRLGELGEGKMHAAIVLSQDILDYAPLFSEIADAYFELFGEALGIYELLGCNETTSSVYVLLQSAECLQMAGELRDAAEVYEAGKSFRRADPNHNEAKMKLAEIYEILNQPRKALDLVYEVIDSRKRRPKEGNNTATPSAPAAQSLIQDKPAKRPKTPTKKSANRLSNAELRAMEGKKEKEVVDGYRRVKQLWPRMLEGEGEPRQQWMLEAEKLIEAFRETRCLFSTTGTFIGMFPTRRRIREEDDEDKMLCRLQFDLGGFGSAL
ncbi:hypothetical protein B0H14DRAFT_3882550 [Mycena olivaceomarginata]|nr:hypothetical protein B0H14DRAFT_3882550 [Mycena olivaceomarginata]